jgi:hypothetical protein
MIATLAALSAALVSACGSGSSLVSASAVGKCAHASQQPASSLPPHTPSQHQVMAKVASGGWLRQDYSAVEQMERKQAAYEIYVFGSAQAAEEAFKLISSTPDAKEEYGTGGTFRRKNVIINAEGEGGSLTADAESLLNKCVGAGASQSIVRPPEELVNGHTRSEITKAEEDGYSFPSTSSETPTASTSEPAQEPPASEDVPNPGQSPAPREGE